MLCCVKEGQRLYLTAWDFNTCRVLGKVAEMVEAEGGQVKPYIHIMANNRTYEPDAEPIRIYGHGYIRFNLDGYQYAFSVNENPYFEHTASKIRIVDGKIPRGHQVYMDEVPRKAWMYDCLFRVCDEEDIQFVAEKLLEALKAMPVSQIARKWHMQNVPNTYDGGWHKERVYDRVEYTDAEV